MPSPLQAMGPLYKRTIWIFFVVLLFLVGSAPVSPVGAQASPEKRLALIVGNAAYKARPLPTPANDAGLVAQTLQAAGFDVIGARDLDQNGLRDAMRDFLTKVNASGPNTVVFVYLAGYGLQYQGDNYFVPVDADIADAADVPIEALRVTDFTRSLAGIKNRGSVVVLDAARANPFVQSNQPLAGGLALVEPDANQLIAFNASPGTVAPQESGPYGSYAHALAEMIRIGGLPLDDVFDRTRLRVSDLTKGAQISWSASKFQTSFMFFDRGPNPPAAQTSSYNSSTIWAKPIGDFDERDAYFAALDRDTMHGYEDFLAAYPNDAMARRVRAIIAARREAITWRETSNADTPEAYWSYLGRYPHGPHVWDANRRLEHFEATLEPPPSFLMIDYDVPPPTPPEIVYVDRPVLYFDNTHFGYAPPPPVLFLPPPSPDFVTLAPPRLSVDRYVLPAPAYIPVPGWVEPAHGISPPENNIIFNNIHNTVVSSTVVDENEAAAASPGLTTGEKIAGATTVAGAGAAAFHVALPPSVKKEASVFQKRGPTVAAPATGLAPAPGKPLPRIPKLANVPSAGLVEKKQLLRAIPDTGRNPAVTQAPPQGANPDAHALPGSSGQPQLPQANGPTVNGQSQIAKSSEPARTPISKLKGDAAFPRPAALDRMRLHESSASSEDMSVKPGAPKDGASQRGNPHHVVVPPSQDAAQPPPLGREPHVSVPAPRRATARTEPKLNVGPKMRAEPDAHDELKRKPSLVERQAKRPPETGKKKTCGAHEQPACP